MGAGRLNTLTTTYQNLKGFKNAETTVKKTEFNQTLKQTKEGKKALNTVYIKYLVYTARDDGTSDKRDEINERILNKTGIWAQQMNGLMNKRKNFLN